MNIIQLFQDYNISFQTEGNKHCRPGWVNIDCPFCSGIPDLHLGFNLTKNYFNCWRCGGKNIIIVIQKLLKISKSEVKEIIKQYDGITTPQTLPKTKITVRKKAFKFPSNHDFLLQSHKNYLEKRKFNWQKLVSNWNIMGTGPISHLDNINFKHRIIIPIHWNGKCVSFQARDITDKSDLKYITCPKNREVIFHKHILFGNQLKWGDVGICVEGVFDVFRFGFNAFATFGIKYTPEQMRLMVKTFKRVIVCYDDDSNAIAQANKLVAELRFRGVSSCWVPIVGDPGNMGQKEVDHLIKQLIK